MKNVWLVRLRRHEQGTEGYVLTPGFNCYSLELPWHDNKRSISCIPAGVYDVELRQSPKYGKIYWVRRVPNRSYILIHSGNFGGDVDKNFKSHTKGCILLGRKFGFLGDQRAVLNSRVAIRAFMSHMNYQSFRLNIQEAF
jgi:hypothetical protein